MDNQYADRWSKQSVKTGNLDLKWIYTALHFTTKWHYYITKPDCNPNETLNRASFEKIAEVSMGEQLSVVYETHSITITKD
ncbi:lytic polysaccharide monooxygenase [Enterococcus sp. DIV0213h]|uniref:lytic polysaccharide monooxygenase n=1 Tax=Enterococcus sp. DIV0213h TaxID=2774669 RepID=UPI003F684712